MFACVHRKALTMLKGKSHLAHANSNTRALCWRLQINKILMPNIHIHKSNTNTSFLERCVCVLTGAGKKQHAFHLI